MGCVRGCCLLRFPLFLIPVFVCAVLLKILKENAGRELSVIELSLVRTQYCFPAFLV